MYTLPCSFPLFPGLDVSSMWLLKKCSIAAFSSADQVCLWPLTTELLSSIEQDKIHFIHFFPSLFP